MKLISENFYRGSQSWNYCVMYRTDHTSNTRTNHTLKVRIKRDSHDAQSYIVGYMLTARGWAELVREPIQQGRHECYHASHVDKEQPAQPFIKDADVVLNVLKFLLKGELK